MSATEVLCADCVSDMCLVLIGYQVCEHAPLVIVANRDEYFERPASPAAFWEDHPNIFAGRDQEEGGTWMGVSRQGRVAAVTNWTENPPNLNADLSRGKLVSDFLQTTESSHLYTDRIEDSRYRGFNLVVFDGQALSYCTNRTSASRQLDPGIYGLSNTKLGDKWVRVIKGEKKLAEQIQKPDLGSLVDMLFDSNHLPFQPQPEQRFEECFIMGETYGTRATTALILTNDHRIQIREQTYAPMGKKLGSVEEEFEFEPQQRNSVSKNTN